MNMSSVLGVSTTDGESTLITPGNRHDNFVSTPAEAIESVLVHPYIKFLLPKGCSIWEPACGAGAISKVLIKEGFNVISTNINERGYGIKGVDFLKEKKRRADVIFTNPPFDAETGSAQDFIFHAGELRVDVLILLLKTNYAQAQKDS